MSRSVPASILTALGQSAIEPFYAVELDLDSGPLRLWTGYGDRTLTANLTGNLSAGDFIQLGTGGSSRLHKVLQDVSSGTSVSIDIWPAVRAVTTTVSYTNTKGVFRLASNETAWGINSSSVYGIQFSAMEDISV